jgi:hypothetical protein
MMVAFGEQKLWEVCLAYIAGKIAWGDVEMKWVDAFRVFCNNHPHVCRDLLDRQMYHGKRIHATQTRYRQPVDSEPFDLSWFHVEGKVSGIRSLKGGAELYVDAKELKGNDGGKALKQGKRERDIRSRHRERPRLSNGTRYLSHNLGGPPDWSPEEGRGLSVINKQILESRQWDSIWCCRHVSELRVCNIGDTQTAMNSSGGFNNSMHEHKS